MFLAKEFIKFAKILQTMEEEMICLECERLIKVNLYLLELMEVRDKEIKKLAGRLADPPIKTMAKKLLEL